MKISQAFPSTYLRAADLDGRNITATISHVDIEKIGNDDKPVIYFKNKDKGLALNKTNANTIASAYGDDTEEWQGGELILFPTIVDYQGKSVDAIRVRIPPRRPAAASGRRTNGDAPPPASPDDYGQQSTELDDDIPF